MENLNEIIEQFEEFKRTEIFNSLAKKMQKAYTTCNPSFSMRITQVKEIMEIVLEPYYFPNNKLMNSQGLLEVAPAIVDVWLEIPDYLYDDYNDSMLEEFYEGYYDDEFSDEEDYIENCIVDKYIFDEMFRKEMQPILEEIKNTIDTEFYDKVQ